MKTINNLTNGSVIRVPKVNGRVTVQTLAGYLAERGQPVKYQEEIDAKFGRETQYAWTMQHAAVISANYPGKAEAHAKDYAERTAAPLVETGDILVIDGESYVAKVMGDFSDPVHLQKV